MLHTRYQSTLAVVGNSLYVVGGDVHQTERTVGTIERYNEEINEWEMITTFPKRRESCAICAIDELIYIFGGCVGCRNYNDWDAYNVITNRWLSENDNVPKNLISSCINGDNSFLAINNDSINNFNSTSINTVEEPNETLNLNSNINVCQSDVTNTYVDANIHTNANCPVSDSYPSKIRLLFPILLDPTRNCMSMMNGATAVTSACS